MDIVPMKPSYFESPLFYPLAASVIALLALYIYMESDRAVQMARKLPGPWTVPFFGNLLMVIGVQPKDVLRRALEYDKYGSVIRVFVGNKLVIFLYDPLDVELILSSSVHIDKSPEYRYFQPWLGDGLLISSGKKWYRHRKIIAPTFHMSILKTFVPLFYEHSVDLVDKLRCQIGKEFDCHDYMSEITVDILVGTAMGVKSPKKEKAGYDYAMAVMKLCEIIHRRQYDLFLRFDTLFQFTNFAKQQKKLLGIIHALSNGVIKTRKEEANEKSIIAPDTAKTDSYVTVEKKETKSETKKNNNMHYVRDDLDDIDDNDVGEKKRLAFLDVMLELAKSGENFTEEEVREEVNTILFEGHDTTAAGSSFVLCLLGIHQDIQERVYQELNGIFGGSDRQCTFYDTLEMKYLERVILETLRLFPPVPAIARQLVEDVKLATQEAVLPRGTRIVIPIFKIHRYDKYYENPEEFNPDNFLPEKMQQRHYYSYIPFSAGPRSCVGRKYAMLKLKVLLSTILRNYKILSDIKEKDFLLRVDIILKRVDGFRIRIEPRNKEGVEA